MRYDFIRLRQTPPVARPPTGSADFRRDISSGALVRVNPDGSTKNIEMSDAAEAVLGYGKTPTEAQKDAFAALIGAGYGSDAVVNVARGSTDSASATALSAAYTAAKALTPGGNALSATNRACVVIPPGGYDVGSTTFTLDGEYVDLIALVPQRAGMPQRTDDPNIFPLADYRPTGTIIYTTTSDLNVVDQTADDVQLVGITISQLASSHTGAVYGFSISASDNGASVYDTLYCYMRAPNSAQRWPCASADNTQFGGTWKNCIGNAYSFRQGGGSSTFTALMFDCHAGAWSFIGDSVSGSGTVVGARLERCSTNGTFGVGAPAAGYLGEASFGGCTSFGVSIDSDTWFVDCTAGDGSSGYYGDRSFAVGKQCSANFVRCRGGANCFGGTVNGSYEGNFDGYAEDCVAGKNSFGGSAVTAKGNLKGTLVRCRSEGSAFPWRCTGATIRDSRLTVAANNIDAITLLDANCVITNSEILVKQGGTGLPIAAASALAAAVAHCRMNNASNDADGFGGAGPASNSISTANNVVDNNVV